MGLDIYAGFHPRSSIFLLLKPRNRDSRLIVNLSFLAPVSPYYLLHGAARQAQDK